MKDIPTTTIDISHHLQRSVLLQLRQEGPQTYQQLKPDGVEGNAYNYHLKNLKTTGLISVNKGFYTLTPTGNIVADAFSFESGRLLVRPHIYTYLLVTREDKVLLYTPSRQPLPDIHGLPSGKLHYGDNYEKSIQREAKRRNLSEDYKASFVCPLNIQYQREDHIVLQRPGNLWHIQYEGPLTESSTPSGSSGWWTKHEIKTLPNTTPEVSLGIERIENASHDPIDLTVSL